MDIIVVNVEDESGIQKCKEIRKEVFIEGQNVPENIEWDGKDNESDHYLLSCNNIPAGTVRIRYLEDVAKIERVAILKSYRGMGLGKEIMLKIISNLKKNKNLSKIRLGSQTHAISFYKKLGFKLCGEEYMDAGIPHINMEMIL